MTEGATALGLTLEPAQADKLVAYLHLIDRWNATYNLTAIRDLRAMVSHHLVDSLAVLPTLRGLLPDPGRGRLLDVGSGAGLPGVVLAVAAPAIDVVCVDSVGKKAAFVTQVAGALRLGNLAARHARVEAMVPPPRYDVVVSRAYASLADFVTSTRHVIEDDGWWVAMKGKLPLDELAGAEGLGATFASEALQVPGLDAERHLLVARNTKTASASSHGKRRQS